MSVLVTGGAGYIGAHVVRVLAARGRQVIIVDDLSTGHRSRVVGVPVVELDVSASGSAETLAAVMAEADVSAVVHLAARKQVGESVERPLWYMQQNVGGLANVLQAAALSGVPDFVFSSSAAVYGDVAVPLVAEDALTSPVSPYGRTKLAGEWLVRDHAVATGMRVACLRYFNVAGAGWGDLGDPAVMNLVTMVLDRLARNEVPVIFGDDYATPDGTCVRDFVHVLDLAEAHIATLDYLAEAPAGTVETLNVGTGRGASVRQVVDLLVGMARPGTRPHVVGRRAGDPAAVVAAVGRIEEVMGWRARHSLESVLSSAYGAWSSRA